MISIFSKQSSCHEIVRSVPLIVSATLNRVIFLSHNRSIAQVYRITACGNIYLIKINNSIIM